VLVVRITGDIERYWPKRRNGPDGPVDVDLVVEVEGISGADGFWTIGVGVLFPLEF